MLNFKLLIERQAFSFIQYFSAFVFLLFTLFACTQTPQPIFKIGTNMWPGYEPLYLARALNHLDSQKVQLVEFTSTSEVIRAFRNGTIDGAAVTLDETLLIIEAGIDAKVILVFDVSAGGDVIVGKPEIRSMAEARGKRVGFENTALGSCPGKGHAAFQFKH
jgi:NitT/TauT family transport system substrate-binding protein